MTTSQQVSQRDLRLRSREIMDAVEHGQTFTVTRDGRGIAELIPLSRKPTFVSREEFVALGRGLPTIDADQFRADLDVMTDPYTTDPFTR